MDAMLTLYILGGGVALAALIFIVMSIATAFRAPKLPELSTLQSQPLPRTFDRALTPRPLPAAAAMISLAPASSSRATDPNDQSAPRTVIPLPALLGVAPATRAKSSPTSASAAHAMSPSAMSPSAMSPSATHAMSPSAAHAMSPGASAPRFARARTSKPDHAMSLGTAHTSMSPGTADTSPATAPRATPPQPSFALPLPAPMETPAPARIPVTLPTLVAPPQLPTRMPRATMPHPIAAVSTRVSWNEEEWRRSAPDVAQTHVHAKAQTKAQAKTHTKAQAKAHTKAQATARTNAQAKTNGAARNNESTQRIIREAPEPSLLRTVLGWTITVSLLATTPAVVSPSLLDSLCDENVWSGADAMVIARDCARDANRAIRIDLEHVGPPPAR